MVDESNSNLPRRSRNIRGDGYGGGDVGLKYRHNGQADDDNELSIRLMDDNSSKKSPIQSHNYEPDESEVWRAYVAQQHFQNRGQW